MLQKQSAQTGMYIGL